MNKRSTEQKAEVEKIREIAKVFEALIDTKQTECNKSGIDYTAKDLLIGTEYEDRIDIQGNLIEFQTALDVYQWLYTPRHGNQSARLTENFRSN